MTSSSHQHPPPPIPFAVERQRLDAGVRVLAVRGELDLFTAPELRRRLRSHVEEQDPPEDLVVDLSACAFVDASGCQALLRAGRRLAAAGRRLVIVNPHAENARVFAVMGLDELYAVVPTQADALAALGARSA